MQKAKASFGRAIRLDPQQASAYYKRSVCHVRLGDEEAAREDLKRALRLDADQELLDTVATENIELLMENQELREKIRALEAKRAPEVERSVNSAGKGSRDHTIEATDEIRL